MNSSQPPIPGDDIPEGLTPDAGNGDRVPEPDYPEQWGPVPSEPPIPSAPPVPSEPPVSAEPAPAPEPPAPRKQETPADEPTETFGGQRLWQMLQDEGDMHEAERNIRREERLMPKDPDPADEPPPERKLFKPEAAFTADPQASNIDLRDKETTSADQEGISRIQRILADPELVEEDVDYRPTHDDGDYDNAVRSFYQDATQSIMCKNHANRPAVDQCPVCQAYFCQECMVVRRGRLLCRDCAETVFIRSEEEILTAQELGDEEAGGEVAPEEKPEFQIGSTAFGVDGRPAHPVKKLFAFLIDLVISRGVVLLLALIMGFILSHNNGAFFHLFDSDGDKPVLNRVIDAALLYQPVMPWLVIFIVADFLYFFSTLSFFNRTVGMSWMSCRIVTEWGEFASFSTVALRVLVFMVLAGWPGILLSWAFPGFRGLHDYAAGTIVINYSGLKRVDAYDTVQIKLD